MKLNKSILTYRTLAAGETEWPLMSEVYADVLTLHAEVERLAAENARLRGALTPSADTKHAYIGEFKFKSASGWITYTVPWPTIKKIMAAIRRQALTGGQ